MPRDGLIRPDKVQVAAFRAPFSTVRYDLEMPAGMTLAAMVDAALPDRAMLPFAVVLIGDEKVPAEWWRRIRPRPGTRITITVMPRGGGGWRLWAQIAIVVAAAAITIATAGGATTLLGVTLGTWGMVAAAAVSIGGSLLLNTILAPPVPDVSRDYGNDKPSYAIAGQRNQIRRYAKLPFALGLFRVTPAYAAEPWPEFVGSDVYWRALFALGHGPLAIAQWRIGDTDISQYQGVELEIRRGYWSYNRKGNWSPALGRFPETAEFSDTWDVAVSGLCQGAYYTAGQTITFNNLGDFQSIYSWDVDQEKPFRLFPNTVHNEELNIEVKNITGPQVRSTKVACDTVAIEVCFQTGLVHLENSPPGKRSDSRVLMRIEQSPVGANKWSHVLTQEVVGRQTTPLYWGHTWSPASYGVQDANKQYDVRVTRVSPDFDGERNIGLATWFSLRSVSAGSPHVVPSACVVAVRIKASGQLNGVLNEFNVIAQTIAKDWDQSLGRWIWRMTSLPGALFRHVLQHPSRQHPAADAAIDLERLAYWDTANRAANRFFNGVMEAKGSVFDALVKICRIGRARPTRRDLMASVVMDEPQGTPVRLFSPRNSWNYEGELSHEPIPNAYRIGFVDSKNDYATDEVVVYDDGFDATSARRIDQVEWIGVANHDQAWKEGRYHLAQQRLRREIHYIMVDFEHIGCECGDLVALQHDVIAVGIGSARISEIIIADGKVTAVLLDAPMMLDASMALAIRVRMVKGGSQITGYFEVTLPEGPPLFDGAPAVDELSSWDNFGATLGRADLLLVSPPAVADGPSVGDLVAVGIRERETLRVLVNGIQPRNDLSAKLTLIAEGAGVHTADTGTIPKYDPVVTKPRGLPVPDITDIRSDASVMLVTAGRELIARAVFTFTPVSFTTPDVIVLMRVTGTNGTWQQASIQERTASTAAIVGVESGETYDFRVFYTDKDQNLFTSQPAQVTAYKVIGRTDVPDPLQNLNVAGAGGQALLRWDLPVDLDVQVGGWILFRHAPDLENATWGGSTSIGRAVSGNQTHVYLPLKPGTYLAKVYDADGRASDTASVSTKQTSVLDYTVVGEIIEDPNFVGEKVDVELVDGALQLPAGLFDDVKRVDELESWDLAGQTVTIAGTYHFAIGLDFGSVRRMRITSHIRSQAVNMFDFIDARGPIDSWPDVDGTAGAPVDAVVWGKLTDDDPEDEAAAWTSFMRIDSAEIVARAVGHIECRLTSHDTTYNIQVLELGMVAEELTT